MSSITQEVKKDVEVSSGNTGSPVTTNNGAAPPVTPQAVPQIAPGSFLVTVDQLDPDVYDNPRLAGGSSLPEDSINELRHNLKTQGQLQNIGVLPSPKGDGKYAVYFGWSRTEAFIRNVFEPLIDKWNKEKGLESTAAEYLVVTNKNHLEIVRAAYPAEFEKEKNKPHNKVYVKIDSELDAANKGAVYVKGVAENTVRKNMTLWQEINALNNLVDNLNYTAKNAGAVLKLSPTVVSLKRKISKLPTVLGNVLITPDAGEVLAEADLVKLKEGSKKLIGELVRRMNLMEGDLESISYSHAREFAARVVKDEKETRSLTRLQIMDRLCALVGANPKTFDLIGAKEIKVGEHGDKVFKSTKSPENYTVWITTMKTYEEENEARAKAAISGVAATETPPTSAELAATVEAQGSTTGTVEGLAATQVGTQQSPPVSTGNVEAVAPSTAASEANADVKLAQPTTAATAASIMGGTAADLDDDVDESPTGLKSTKTSAAPTLQVKVKEAHIILAAVETFKVSLQEIATDEHSEASMAQVATFLGQICFGYQMLGMDREYQQYQGALIEYSEQSEQYTVAAENLLEAKKIKFTQERPTVPELVFEGVGPAEPLAGLAEETADDDEIDEIPGTDQALDDEEVAPTDEELEDFNDDFDDDSLEDELDEVDPEEDEDGDEDSDLEDDDDGTVPN